MEHEKRAFGYVRVSTGQQASSGLGLQDQRDKIKSQADLLGANLVEIVADEGESGTTDDRPGWNRVLSAARRKQIDTIIIAKLDRCTRSIIHLCKLLKELDRHGCALVSATDPIDTSTANGRAMMKLIVVFAEWEADVISERTKAALAAKRAQGKRISGRAPYGYRWDGDGNVVRHPHERNVICYALRARKRGETWQKIADDLSEGGYPQRCGTAWSKQGISNAVLRYYRARAAA